MSESLLIRLIIDGKRYEKQEKRISRFSSLLNEREYIFAKELAKEREIFGGGVTKNIVELEARVDEIKNLRSAWENLLRE